MIVALYLAVDFTMNLARRGKVAKNVGRLIAGF